MTADLSCLTEDTLKARTKCLRTARDWAFLTSISYTEKISTGVLFTLCEKDNKLQFSEMLN